MSCNIEIFDFSRPYAGGNDMSDEVTKYNNYNKEITEWLLEDKDPEIKLRVLKEYLGKSDDDMEVIKAKKNLLSSAIFATAMELLKSEKVWSKYDAITSFAEWGLTRKDINIDSAVYEFIEQTKFKPMCGEALLLRNLVKLGYYEEPNVKEEISEALQKIKEDGGFGCLSKSKKINDPKQPHKSCVRITSNYLLLIAEMKINNIKVDCEKELVQYFLKRNVIYRTDDMKTIIVDGMENTYYPPDAVMNGIQNIIYALCILGEGNVKNCTDGWNYLNSQSGEHGKYILGKSKTKPCFKVGAKGKPNKWVTLYAFMADKIRSNATC